MLKLSIELLMDILLMLLWQKEEISKLTEKE
jgi:hypothetical protein